MNDRQRAAGSGADATFSAPPLGERIGLRGAGRREDEQHEAKDG